MESTEKTTESRNITVSSVGSWIIGVLLIIVGISTIVTNPLSAIVYIVLGIIFTPVTNKKIEDKFKIKLSRGIKIVILILGIIFASTLSSDIVSNESANTSDNKTEEIVEEPVVEKVQNEKQTTTVSESPKQEQVDNLTTGERQAVLSAKKYLGYSSFSRKGLIKQLEFEGFTNQEAVYGVDQTNADWNAQAAKSAKKYIEYSSFSRSGLITQLEYEGYTRQQAEYGATAVGY